MEMGDLQQQLRYGCGGGSIGCSLGFGGGWVGGVFGLWPIAGGCDDLDELGRGWVGVLGFGALF